jgi:hypothetical protein
VVSFCAAPFYNLPMDWRAWGAYGTGAREYRRALPGRGRYSWGGIVIFALIVAFAMLIVVSLVHAQAAKLTDAQTVETIIQVSRHDYYGTGHPCACPYDHARNGSMCGAA